MTDGSVGTPSEHVSPPRSEGTTVAGLRGGGGDSIHRLDAGPPLLAAVLMLPDRPSLHGTERTMSDIAYVLLTVAFFGLSWLYVRACARV